MSIRKRVLKGVGANALGQGVNVVVQLAGLPIFVAIWGVEKYGEWLVLSSLAAVLTVSDVGFASAAANEMTMCVGRGDRNSALVVYQSMWALLCGVGGVMLLTVVGLAWLTPMATWLPVTYTPPETVVSVLTILAAYVLVGQQVSVLQAGFRCDGNYALGQTTGAGMRLFEFSAQALAAALTGSMTAVAAAALGARLLSFVAITIVLSRKSPWLRHGVQMADRRVIKLLFMPALAFMGMPVSYALLNQGAVQVVAAALGPASVAVFAAHRALANTGIQCIALLNRAVRPEISLAFGANDLAMARQLNRKMCQITAWMSLACILAIATVAIPLFWIWTQDSISADYSLLMPLLVVVTLRSAWLSSYVVPSAINRHLSIAALFVPSAALSLLASAYLTPAMGLLGTGLSLIIADAIMSVVVFRITTRLVHDSVSGFLLAVASPPRLQLSNLQLLRLPSQ